MKHISSYVFNTKILTCDETADGLVYIGDALVDDIGEEMAVAKIREGTRIIAEGCGEVAIASSDVTELSAEEQVELYISEGASKMDAIKRVAKERGVHKNEIYKLFNKD